MLTAEKRYNSTTHILSRTITIQYREIYSDISLTLFD